MGRREASTDTGQVKSTAAHQEEMGIKGSKSQQHGGRGPGIVPKDSPLERMIRNWKNNPKPRGKDKKKRERLCNCLA